MFSTCEFTLANMHEASTLFPILLLRKPKRSYRQDLSKLLVFINMCVLPKFALPSDK